MAVLSVVVTLLIFLPEMGLNLGKVAAECVHRSDCSLQGLALAEGDKILRRIAETKTVSSALRAQQLHFGGSEISNQTRNQGLFLNTNPSSSFFYVFTALHALHLLGGVTALGYILVRLYASPAWPPMDPLDATSLYWHFMDVLWLYLLAVLALWF